MDSVTESNAKGGEGQDEGGAFSLVPATVSQALHKLLKRYFLKSS